MLSSQFYLSHKFDPLAHPDIQKDHYAIDLDGNIYDLTNGNALVPWKEVIIDGNPRKVVTLIDALLHQEREIRVDELVLRRYGAAPEGYFISDETFKKYEIVYWDKDWKNTNPVNLRWVKKDNSGYDNFKRKTKLSYVYVSKRNKKVKEID